MRRLAGHTAIVALDTWGSEALARRLGAEGAAVIIVAEDAAASGRLAASMREDDQGAPVAVYCPEGPLEDEFDALVELVTELSRTGRP